MAERSKKFITKKRTAVRKHSVMHKKVVENQPQTLQNQEAPQGPKSDLPPPTIQAYPQPQPIQPQSANAIAQPTISINPAPSPVSSEAKPIIDNLTTQPQGLEAKSETVQQVPAQPIVNTNAPSNIANSNEINSLPSQENEPEKKSKLWIIITVIVIVLIAVGGALYYFRIRELKQITKENKVEPSPTISSVTPTVSQATESANLNVSLQYKIRVLNGSGISGEASKVRGLLEEEKFVVEDIDNADSSDYEKTIIRAKKDVSKEYIDTLKKLLGKTYVLDTEEELKESADVEVIIIIGKSQKP